MTLVLLRRGMCNICLENMLIAWSHVIAACIYIHDENTSINQKQRPTPRDTNQVSLISDNKEYSFLYTVRHLLINLLLLEGYFGSRDAFKVAQ